MKEIEYWVPGDMMCPEGPLARYGDPTPRGVADACVRAYTSPGDLVIVPFCGSASLVREIQATGRQVLALDFNPVGVLSLRMALAPPTRDELIAAFIRLGDAPKAGTPLREHLERLYTFPCPRCQRPAIVEAVVRDRTSQQAVEQRYRCRACGEGASGPAAEPEVTGSERVEERGLAYWYLADRVTSASSGHRPTVQRLLNFYSPRNLYALAQILIKVESLFADSPSAEAVRGALLGCLDVGSSLYAADAPEARPRQLRLPPQYLERNLWDCFGRACESPSHQGAQTHLVPDLGSFLKASAEQGKGLVYLEASTLRSLADRMDSTRVALILAMPARLDPLFWSLSYLWSGWLYGPQGAAALESLLGRRSNDWEWYRQSMARAFGCAAKLLTPDGHLLLVGGTAGPSHQAALLLAASEAGLTLVHGLSGGEQEVQLHFRRKPSCAVPSADREIVSRGAVLAKEAMCDLLRARGEPTLTSHLRLAAAESLAQAQHLYHLTASEDPVSRLEDLWKALEDTEAFVRFEGGRWWLRDEAETAAPLADRVERAVHELLAGSLGFAHEALLRLVCGRFPGPLTPEVAVIEACLRSYAEEFSPGYWRLRVTEEAGSQDTQAAQMVLVLRRLGSRMGYEVEDAERPAEAKQNAYDVTWQEEGQLSHGFLVRWRAQVATDILHSPPEPPALEQHYVLPEARVPLAQAKLAHDPRLTTAMAKGSWQFLKYAPLRALAVAEEVVRHDLRRIVGLEPIIEQPTAQIPLF